MVRCSIADAFGLASLVGGSEIGDSHGRRNVSSTQGRSGLACRGDMDEIIAMTPGLEAAARMRVATVC